MKINQEIQRLTQAKKDFKTKLIEKGVAVSDDELISDYPPKLDLIKTGVDTTDATATSEDILLGKTAYVDGEKVEGVIETYDGEVEGGQKAHINLVKNIMDRLNDTHNKYDYAFYNSTFLKEDFEELDEIVINVPESIEQIWRPEQGDSEIAKLYPRVPYDYMFYGILATKPLNFKFYQPVSSGPNSNSASSFKYTFSYANVEELNITIMRANNTIDTTYGNAQYMFQNSSVKTINFVLPNGSLSPVSNYVFRDANNLETINVVDQDGVEGFTLTPYSSSNKCYYFSYCTNLTNVRFRRINCSTLLGSGTSYGHLLTLDSLLSAIQACQNNTKSFVLTIGTTNIAKLEGVYVKIVDETNTDYYPFVQCESTDEGAMTVQDYMALKNWSIA